MGDTHDPERFERVESALKQVAMDLKLLSSALKVQLPRLSPHAPLRAANRAC